MTLRLSILVIAALGLSACDSNHAPTGIRTLGKDFVRAFSQNANAEPLDASTLKLTLTPTIEPFNP